MTIEDEFAAAYRSVLARWPGPVEVSDVDSAYGTTRLVSTGPTGAPPVVLLPGGGATAAVWFGNDLAGRRVHALDLPGNAGYTQVSVRDVDELCGWLDTTLPAGAVDLVGHSYGAWVALTYALHAPDRVRRLALLDPTQCFAGFSRRYLLHALPVILRPTAARARALIRWETGGRALPPAWSTLHGLGAELPSTGRVVGRPGPAADRIRALPVPTLVLLAGRSRVHDVGKVERRARELLRDVRTQVLPAASHHSLPFDPAADVDRALLDFLS